MARRNGRQTNIAIIRIKARNEMCGFIDVVQKPFKKNHY